MDAYEQERADRAMYQRHVAEPAGLDMDAHYKVSGYGGVAFYLIGYAEEWTPQEYVWDGDGDPEDEGSYLYSDPELIEDRTRVRAVMVGDDHVWTFDVSDLQMIPEDAFCRECGQIGCGHAVWE